ncbi:MAG: pilus assembly protein [Alphaproteobacteria bacterium]|nr:pilus assembly protein [Alphaproteobacteria bacterium]
MRNSLGILRLMRRVRPAVPGRQNGERGSTAVEFAFIAPVLFSVMLGTIEVSMIMFVQHQLEGAAYNASRTGKTGYKEAGKTQTETIKAALIKHLSNVIDTDEITISSEAYTTFSKVGQPEPYVDANGNGHWDTGENFTDVNGNGTYDTDQGKTGAGSSSEIVVYTIGYPWKIMTPLMSEIFGNNGDYPLEAKIVVRNEPY